MALTLNTTLGSQSTQKIGSLLQPSSSGVSLQGTGSNASSILQPHPALSSAANSHPTTLTTSPDGTVKATYSPETVSGLVNPTPTQTGTTPNGQPIMTGTFAPGSPQNGGAITQNNATPGSQNGTQVGGEGYVDPYSSNYYNNPGAVLLGNTTPNGAVVNTTTGGLISPAGNQFGNTINTLTGLAGGNTAIGQNAANIASNYGKQIADVNKQAAGLENAYGTTPGMAFPTSQGLSQTAAATAGQITQGLAQGESAALQGTGQQLTAQQQAQQGLGTVGGLIQPQVGQQGQTYYNPLNPTQMGGGAIQLTGVTQTDINNLSNAVANGTMNYDTAISQLSGYGTAVQNQLLPAIQKIKPDFNVAQSNTLSTQQGQVAPAIQNASLTLQSLSDSMNQLQIPGQDSSFTPLNSLTNWASQNLGWGKEQTAAVVGKVNEARNALQAALSITGTNPNEATAQSYSLLPDNPSRANINAAIKVLNDLGAIKQQVYGNPGASGNNNQQTNATTNTTGAAGWL